MNTISNKIYLAGDRLIIHDPTPLMSRFLKTADPTWRVHSIAPANGFIPAFQNSMQLRVGISKKDLLSDSISELRKIHKTATEGMAQEDCRDPVSLLELKKEMAFRLMASCELCAHKCLANRYRECGNCGLDHRAYLPDPFVHIAEEDPIRPALMAYFAGCSWQCVYCISHYVKNPKNFPPLNVAAFWKKALDLLNGECPVNTFEFAGGNPTESLPWALELLASAPSDFNSPIVWNSNPFASEESIQLLNGIVDVYLIDFRYGNDECAKKLSGIDNYLETATTVLEFVIRQNVRVIIRILILPNHLNCCHLKALECLSSYKDRVWISILDQYIPEHNAYHYPEINRRPTEAEIKEIEDLVGKFGLRNIRNAGSEFWEEQI